MECEFVVAVPPSCFTTIYGRCGTCALLIPSALLAGLTTIVSDDVLVHPLRCFQMPVEDPADRFKFARMDVVEIFDARFQSSFFYDFIMLEFRTKNYLVP